ncbi:hypothetical protein [Alkalihalobacillus sp. AL-G]|uniref:hypothetical protein n=1 Tax=Alkalihalobacillus sp. AL-G TaxID=2926399 RepID=UPI00272BCD03|nr:hypothetical protein [Alkalihalobacillus sp. AL-G]WLD94848.1 hypothetical protein MOJ78_08195 [Alkalihalobacillus sp. AL-G]
MKNKSILFHTGLLICFALPWINVPFFISNVTISGYMLPFKTSELAQQLTELGVVTVSFHEMLPLFLILMAPVLSCFLLLQAIVKRKQDVRLDCLTGFICANGALYVLSNADEFVSVGVFAVIPIALLLVASPLLHKEKAPTYSALKKPA